MGYLTDFIVLLIWTGICVVLVSGLEWVLGLFGFKAQSAKDGQDHLPPRANEDI
jgi:hypothetical protein